MAVSEVRLMVAPKEARLMILHDGNVVEDELWKLPRPMGLTEIKEVVKAVFDSTYDFINYSVNGDD